MTEPLISVVIPTRNRPDTLAICLRAMRHHRSHLIEILVQDNCSGPETRQVVVDAHARDSRIRYARAPYPTSQRHNFELGLAAARGAYLSIVGDDDGYCVGSLDWLVSKLQERPVDAVRWRLLHYVWPSLSTDDEGFANLYPTMCFGGSGYASGAAIAEQALTARTAGSWDNILVYHGMISRRVYDRMRAMTDGVFFPYPMPEVYAHNVIPLFCDRILQVNDIVSIYGTSGHSAGSSWARVISSDDRDAAEGRRWMSETVADEVGARVPWQPDIRTLRYHDFSSYKLAERHGMLAGRKVDHGLWIDAILAEIGQNPWQLTPWLSAEERAPFDAEVFHRVRATFDRRCTIVPVPGRKFTPDPRLPALRVRSIDPSLPDDVEGAALAVARVMADVTRAAGDEVDRYGLSADASPRARLLGRLGALAVRVQRRLPVLCTRIMHSPYLPRSLWRFLKSCRWPHTPRSALLARHIAELHAPPAAPDAGTPFAASSS